MYGLTFLVALLGLEQANLMNEATLNGCLDTTLAFGYILCYCLTAAVLRRLVLSNLPTHNVAAAAIFVGLAVWLVPFFTAFLLTRDTAAEPYWSLAGSPMILVAEKPGAKAIGVVVVAVWLIVAVPASLPWLIGQFRRFTPYDPGSAPTRGAGRSALDEAVSAPVPGETPGAADSP